MKIDFVTQTKFLVNQKLTFESHLQCTKGKIAMVMV